MHYVYIIRSNKDNSNYIGTTADLKRRLEEHNKGGVTYTKSKTPYSLAWYCVFKDKSRAIEFEKYLKQGSGYAFAKKHLI